MQSKTTVVISQPMYFPWIGLFEQIKQADVFVFLDHVQFARGFINRVQYKTPQGSQWLTVPLVKHKRDTPINELKMANDNWQEKHLALLATNFKSSPHVKEALGLMETVFEDRAQSFCDMIIKSIMVVRDYFELAPTTTFCRSSEIGRIEKKGQLIKELVQFHGGSRYVTGLGALNYLDHEDFELNGIMVEYMDYQKLEYPQPFPPFTPFVSILDLIANVGKEGHSRIISGTCPWRDLLQPKLHSYDITG